MPFAADIPIRINDRSTASLHNARFAARPAGRSLGCKPSVIETIEAVGRSISSLLAYQALARLGLLVKGMVFIAMGCLSGFVAIGANGDCLNAYGVVIQLVDGGCGMVALALITLGFFGYALFKTTGAICDTDGKSWGAIGLLKRASMLLRAGIYAGLGTLALGIMLGNDRGDGSGDALARAVIGALMQHTHGDWLVLSLGTLLVVVALLQFYMIRTAYVRRRLRLEDMRPGTFKAITCFARTGYLARGIVALGMGALMMSAGWHADPATARGLGGTLRWLDEQTYVPYLLAPVSVGFVTYGIFEIFLTYYRRLCVTEPKRVARSIVAGATEPVVSRPVIAPEAPPRRRAANASLLNSWNWTPSPWHTAQLITDMYDPAADARAADLRAIGLAADSVPRWSRMARSWAPGHDCSSQAGRASRRVPVASPSVSRMRATRP